MSGADISALKTLEDDGAIYLDRDGAPGNAIEILQDQGIGWFRLRLFVDPAGEGVVNNDLEYTTALAKRIKDAGGRFLLDFHYSDTWADPGAQGKPKAWEDLGFDELVGKVESYSRDTIEHLAAAGAMPDMVQVGNEINAGMLWPDGQLWIKSEPEGDGFDRLARLLKAGFRGVAAGTPDGQPQPLRMVHISRGDRADQAEYYFERILDRGVQFDLIGFSYYPRYHGSIDQVRQNLHSTAKLFKKPIILVELGYAYTDDETGPEAEPQRDQFEYPITPEGQAAFTHKMVEVVQSVPDNLGRGIFWWHAAATPTKSHLPWSRGRLGLFDENGQVLPAAAALCPGSPDASEPE